MTKSKSATKVPPPPTCALVDALRHLNPAGPCGFEGLVRNLLEQLTSRTYRLARSGGQFGHDVRSTDAAAPVIFVEAKKYEDNTGLSRRELAGELAEAVDRYEHIDLWVLAATKEVGSDEDGLVKRDGLARAVEILVLDVREVGEGPLQVLCAAYADTTTVFLKAHASAGTVDHGALSRRLNAIRSSTGFADALLTLKQTVGGLLLGYTDACARMAEWLRRHIAGINDSMVVFNQDVALNAAGRNPVRREFIARDADAWWTAGTPAHFALLGAKGTGKTWAVFGWLLDLLGRDDPPLVIPVTSNMAPRADVLDVVADTLERCLRDTLGKPSLWWRRRIAFWLRVPASPVRILLVLDGLNEAPDAPWRALLASAGATDIGARVRLLMTCREPYWKERIPGVPGSVTVRRTDGYEGDVVDRHTELRQALAPRLTPEELPGELLALVRQPLYCDLVITHYRELVETGDFTVERLLYLEARETHRRKLGQPINDQQFHEILGSLARRHVDAWKAGGPKPRFGESDLTALVPAGTNAPAILQDIIDGGLLRPSGRHSQPYEVDETRLTYGLGMLLAEHLQDCDATSVDDLAEAAQVWLEPHPDMDLKTSAVGAAVFFALDQTTHGYPAEHRQALLRLWIKARNRDEPTGHVVAAYIHECPDDVLAVADHFWRKAHDHPTVQRAYAAVLLERWKNPTLQDHLVAAVKRWMGYVHAKGHPILRHSAERHPDRLSPADRLAQNLGVSAEPGTTALFHGSHLPITDDDGHLRLARFALMLVSGGPRRPFLEAFVQWAVSRRLMEYPDEYREVAWTLRLTDEELWPALESRLVGMAESANDIVRRAADMVLEALGDRESRSLRDRVLAELHQFSNEHGAHLADPCTSRFALERDQCEPCLDRFDVAMHRLLEKVGRYFVDPALSAPEAFVERLRASAKNFDGDHFWRFDGASAESHAAEQHFPAWARFAPDALGDLMRQAWKSREARTWENTRGLMINLKAIAPLLPPGTMMELGAYLSSVPLDDASGQSDGRTAEAFGFVALAMVLPAEAAALRLVYRPPATLDLTILEPWLRPLPPGSVAVLAERLLVETDPVRAARILWLLQTTKPTLTDRHRSVILAAAQGDHHRLSAAALEFIFRTRNPDLVSGILDGPCTFTSVDDRSTRNNWGIAVLCAHADRLSFSDLLERLPISAIGRALVRRGSIERDANWYADILGAAWRGLGGMDQGVFNLAPPEITVEDVDGGQVPRVAEPRREGGTRFVSVDSTWGGQAIDATADAIREILAPDPNALALRQNRYFEAYYQALKQSPKGFWEMPVDTAALRAVCAVRPDLVGNWVDAAMRGEGGARSLRRADAFYQSLCHALAEVDPGHAFALRDRMRCAGHIRFLVSQAGTDELTALPFSAPETPEALAARHAMLDGAMSDSDLLELATIAAAFGRGDWIAEKARELASSPFLWRKTKGAMLATLSDLDEAVVDALLKGVEEDVAGSWVQPLLPAMREGHRRNIWARHWYRQYLAAPNWDEAYAAFTLFLNSTDRRCRLWMDTEDEAARQNDGSVRSRLLYRQTNTDAIDRAVGINEKHLNAHFLKIKFEARQLVPFGGP